MKAMLAIFWILLLFFLSFTAVDLIIHLANTPASDDMPDFETIAPLALCWGAWYITPGVVALIREHHQTLAIWVLNIFAGWSVIGWVAALVWAFTAVRRNGAVGRRWQSASRRRPRRRRG